MRRMHCVFVFFGLCLVTSWAAPRCQKGKADIVVLIENSKNLLGSDFAKMKKDVESFIKSVKIGTGGAEVVIALRTFGNGVTKYGNPYPNYFKRNYMSAADLLATVRSMNHKDAVSSDMVGAMDNAMAFLRKAGRSDAKQYVVYVGSGRGINGHLVNVLSGDKIKVFGIVVTFVEEKQLRPEVKENVNLFDGYSLVGSQDTLLRVMGELHPNCAECDDPVMELALVIEDIGPKDKFEVMKETVVHAIQKATLGKNTNIAVVFYGSKVKTQSFGMGMGISKNDLIKRVKGLPFSNSNGGDIFNALKHTIINVFNKGRKGAAQVAVLLTKDPQPTNYRVQKITKNFKDSFRNRIHLAIAGFENFSDEISMLTRGSRFAAFDGKAFTYKSGKSEGYGKDLAHRTCLIGEFLQ